MYYNKFRENLILQLNENLVFHFNQEQFYKVKRKKWRKSRLSSMKCILEISLQKINKNYKSQFLSHNIKNIPIFKLPLQVPGILFMFRRQMLNKTFVNLEYITVILFNRWLAYQWVNISKRTQWFQTSFSIFQCICDPCSTSAI